MNDKELQQLLDDSAGELGVVGAQLAIYDGQRTREFATGYRNRELGLSVTPDTLFQIGSTTKIFNAALILALVDDGEISLDAPVREYICDFRLADSTAEQTVTLRQLLSMSAGLDNGPYYDYGRGDDALDRYIDVLAGVPHVFTPGSAFGYSNAATNVAGYVAARVMRQTWEQLLSERIWAPLGLKQSALFAEDLLWHPIALGYRGALARSEPQRAPVWSYPRALAPAGSLTCCSAGDLIRLACMFLTRGRSMDRVQVISEAAIETMQQPQIRVPTRLAAEYWCLGPYLKHWDGHILYGHNGTNLSGSSMLLWCPEKNVGIATLVNVPDRGYLLAEVICDVVFPHVFNINKPRALTPETAIPVQTDLEPYVGRFEAFGMIRTFAIEGNKLKLTSTTAAAPETDVAGSELIPLGEGRFLPCDLRVSGNRNLDMAFWGHDASGRATHLLHGLFPLRRTS